mmetsp:Transcript_19907/g.25637  ORF Transcript_19907/g.25637 Transcript_19907/m.25637 type:complete len:244 (-) Transcript_19907:200-931(-)|eukprot:CAMPEP_0198151596 /NCGR_PEP_ID=MMETSP1443-20131203/56237_1 /TAXON_ID=186043 /ORGANISM="Entomoneis sp., Strain CCMP2396" /LENGTH=243 /DNA_ID=CAMNT_0043817321 /DNA_START=105 /DNA_END=836 /DNA_ORIENTATION=+
MTAVARMEFVNLPHGLSTGTGGAIYDDASVAQTALATEVGSVMLRTKDAFLRSITLFKEEQGRPPTEWSIVIKDGPMQKKRTKKRGILLDSIGGCISLSQFKIGDSINQINGKKLGSSYNAERATELLHRSYEEDGCLYISVGNETGADNLVHATIIKPKPNMTYEEMGMTVWIWGVLCIKEISKQSIFACTVLKDTDHIISVNDISCKDMQPAEFAHVIEQLPMEIQIVVKRGKPRWFGGFH